MNWNYLNYHPNLTQFYFAGSSSQEVSIYSDIEHMTLHYPNQWWQIFAMPYGVTISQYENTRIAVRFPRSHLSFWVKSSRLQRWNGFIESQTNLRYSTPNGDFIRISLYFAWRNYMCYVTLRQKFRNFHRPDFFTTVIKMMSFHNFDRLRKRCIL